MDNYATGHYENIAPLTQDDNFVLFKGDRNLKDFQRACKGMEYVLHQAALCSVPRPIYDPNISNSNQTETR